MRTAFVAEVTVAAGIVRPPRPIRIARPHDLRRVESTLAIRPLSMTRPIRCCEVGLVGVGA